MRQPRQDQVGAFGDAHLRQDDGLVAEPRIGFQQAVDQTYEVEALVAKHHKTQKQVLDAIKKAGPLRVKVERALRK